MQENSIDSLLHETRTFLPTNEFLSSATIKDIALRKDLDKKAKQNYEQFWATLAKSEISWKRPFEKILNRKNAPNYTWFEDGLLNLSYNCIDRHLETIGDKNAIIFEDESGNTRTLTYKNLHQQVCQFANALKSIGAKKGDRIIIYMPMAPEAVIAMQACARIGAIHSVVFGGFSAKALKDRIDDAGAKIIVTADGAYRGGKVIELKKAVDEAINLAETKVNKTIVLKRSAHTIAFNDGIDVWWSDIVAEQSNICEPEWIDSEHPLFLLYTSGSTGKPKGIQHSSAGYLLGSILSLKWVFDIQSSDIFWCTADVGWITGHTYVAYGPLANGATILMYEGGPMTPDAGRFWKLCEDHKVTIFYTAPTAIRALIKHGNQFPNSYDLSNLRLLGTVGEPINPEAWMWYHEVIGKKKCPIVDTWWQTETGSIMIAPIPGITQTKPGSCTLPLPGIIADVVDESGNSIEIPEKGGYLVIKEPWPSMLRTIWNDNDRYVSTYWSRFTQQYYLAGDSARKDKDGYFWIMGRIDDVINVSGHRLGTMEIESALVAHPRVAEAAVVGRPDDLKGESICAFLVLKGDRPKDGIDNKLENELRDWVSKQIGSIAKPDQTRFSDNLPKTRSGKIMRRLLKVIANNEVITQDTSTLENEHIILQLQGKT